jgi:glutamate racemase
MDGCTVLYFDSGIGGLSVFTEVDKLLANVNTIYAFDNKYFPYGILPEDKVIERCSSIIKRLLELYRIDIIVVACNTASTVVLPTLRSSIKIPIVGVVPAIKPAAQISKTKYIGLLATPATVSRKYTDMLIEDYAKDCFVEKLGSSELVRLAELKLHKNVDVTAEVAKVLYKFKGNDQIDVVVLGCTHFPWLKTEIEKTLTNVRCIDSGIAIANRVKFLLKDKIECGVKSEKIAFMTDTNIPDYAEQLELFKKFKFSSLNELKI